MSANNKSELRSGNLSILLKLDEEVWNSLLPVTVYLAILIAMGIVGNSLVGIIWSTKMKRSSTNVCVLLLAFYDILTCMVGIPLDIHDLSVYYTSDNAIMCKVSRFLINISVYGSITVLVFIAILRYVKVCKPLSTFPLKSRGIILISTGMGLGLSWPVLLLHGLEIRPTPIPGLNGQGCGIVQHLIGTIYPNIYFAVLGVIFVGACILLTVLYACIAWHIFRRNQRRRTGSFGQTHNKKIVVKSTNGQKTESRPLSSQSAQRSFTVTTNSIMFFAITLAFVLSFLPSMVMLSIKAKRPHIEVTLNDWQFAAFMFCFRTYFINNCINPILYGFWNRRFREECMTLMTSFREGCRIERPDHSTTGNPSEELKSPPPPVTSKANLRPPSLSSLELSSSANPENCAVEKAPISKSTFYTETPLCAKQ
ncbi:apelin receptor A-like [Liolophura sinensis]|uniref:apelin receptor A-like n=1 Tax=Liolophura sinensis TaxID=3198878 RepID=UPI003158C73A